MTLQQVYRCAIDPELFAAKIEEAEKLSDDLNTGTVFVAQNIYEAQLINLAEWNWTNAPETKELKTIYTRPLKEKLDALKIAHEIVWEPGPGEDTRERVEAVKRWFVHDWQTLDNKIRSSIVEGVSVFLAMFDMPDVAKVFCPVAPLVSDDPQAIILQAAIKRARAGKGREGRGTGEGRRASERGRGTGEGRGSRDTGEGRGSRGTGDQIHMGRTTEAATEPGADEGGGPGARGRVGRQHTEPRTVGTGAAHHYWQRPTRRARRVADQTDSPNHAAPTAAL